MNDTIVYTDLLKAHKYFFQIESRYRFYEAYLQSKDTKNWFSSPEVPLKEGLLLFGWVHSWEPEFEGDLKKFLQIYKDIFELIKKFESESLIQIHVDKAMQGDLCVIFDRVANCCKKTRYTESKRYESTGASKLLHGIIPSLFVMWDRRIRNNLVSDRLNGECYAYEFLPNMQIFAKQILDSYISDKGGDYDGAVKIISSSANSYTLAKLIDEFNYLRYTCRKSLTEIRAFK